MPEVWAILFRWSGISAFSALSALSASFRRFRFMAVVAAQVAVSTTATLLSADSDGGGASVLVQAPAAAILYVGGAGVTSAAGFPIPAGQSLSVDLAGPNDQLYGILASGTGNAVVLRTGA